ncbi:MAG: Flp pilus assembly protein CpaB [Defluviimonas denitrificans]
MTEPGVDAGINANLSPGMRAFTINVDVSTGVSGFLRPGDRVDVYWSGQINGQDTAKLIDEAVRLIAINQSADADRSEETMIARTVTIEGSPQQVAALALAQQTGRLTLSLVGTNDTATVGALEIDRNSLLGISRKWPRRKRRKRRSARSAPTRVVRSWRPSSPAPTDLSFPKPERPIPLTDAQDAVPPTGRRCYTCRSVARIPHKSRFATH